MSKPNNTQGNPGTPAPTQDQNQNQGQGGGAAGGNKNSHKTTFQGPSKNNVTALPGMCLSEGCKKRSEKANFCMEHFDWFKEGLITKEGRRPSDFDKKHFDYTRRLAKKKTA